MGKTREEYFQHLRSYVRERIRQEREGRGMRQADLAERAGVTEKWISRLETRGDNLSLKSLASISWALGIDVGCLLPSPESDGDTPEIQHARLLLAEAPPPLAGLMVGLLKAAREWWGNR